MALNPAYVTAPSLQSYFVDKSTGSPLSGGFVYFYEDNARTVYKNVYRLSGNPNNYQYTALPNPVVLSAVGTIQDNNGNDVIPYFLPQVSLEDDSPDLYYIVVTASDGTPQFTREAWPNPDTGGGSISNEEVINFVPNGQLLAHTNLPNEGLIVNATAETILAQGGFSFNRPAGSSTAADYVTFERYDEWTDDPSSSPRYAIQIESTATSSDLYKDLRVKFKDVNKFSSETQYYTFSFFAISVQEIQAQIVLIKNYGTGGSSEDELGLEAITISPDGAQISVKFIPGINSTKTIGTLNDDYLQLAIRLPSNITFTTTFTDFVLTEGETPVQNFPQTTDADFLSRGVAGWMDTPDYDGNDLYLPLILTREGMTFDNSQVGKIEASVLATPGDAELLCDGSAYQVSEYSTVGIPYRRLFNKLSAIGTTIPLFGTGSAFATANLSDMSGTLNQIRLSTNQSSAALTNSSDNNTTFTITTAKAAANTYAYNAYIQSSGSVLAIGTIANSGALTVAAAGTSGFSLATLLNQTGFKYEFTIATVAASGLANPGGAGKYFTFSNTTTNYYMWFHFTNETDPAPGGTGIQVELKTTYTAHEVACYVAQALSGYQISNIVTVAASSMAAGTWWRFNTSSTAYYVWYTISGAGSDPAPVGLVGIEVAILTGDTDVQVAAKTKNALNSVYFAVPDARGLFLRGWNDSSGVDPDASIRFIFGNNTDLYGDNIGTEQLGAFQSHTHLVKTNQTVGGGSVGGGGNISFPNEASGGAGGNETRPINMYVNYVIKY